MLHSFSYHILKTTHPSVGKAEILLIPKCQCLCCHLLYSQVYDMTFTRKNCVMLVTHNRVGGGDGATDLSVE